MLPLILLLSITPFTLSIECVVCDSFSEYCQLDGSTCVGAKCATRTAILPQGFIRLQKLCVTEESPIGCRDSILWDGRRGEECVCQESMCNTTSLFSFNFVLLFICSILLLRNH